ncbi:hypothetical protein ACR9L4_08195 [Helicobacter pylori]
MAINHSIIQPFIHSSNQAIKHSIIQSSNQSFNQSFNQPSNATILLSLLPKPI